MERYSQSSYIKASVDNIDLLNQITKTIIESLPFKLGKMRQDHQQYVAYFDFEAEKALEDGDRKTT